MSSIDCCYKIFGVRWSMRSTRSFNVVSEQRIRQFFDIFQHRHHPPRSSAHPRAWTKMKWRSILVNQVIPEIRCSQHFRHSEPYRGRGRDKGSVGWGSETPKVGCWQLRTAPRTSRVTRSDTAKAAGILNKDVTRTDERRRPGIPSAI